MLYLFALQCVGSSLPPLLPGQFCPIRSHPIIGRRVIILAQLTCVDCRACFCAAETLVSRFVLLLPAQLVLDLLNVRRTPRMHQGICVNILYYVVSQYALRVTRTITMLYCFILKSYSGIRVHIEVYCIQLRHPILHVMLQHTSYQVI